MVLVLRQHSSVVVHQNFSSGEFFFENFSKTGTFKLHDRSKWLKKGLNLATLFFVVSIINSDLAANDFVVTD